MPKKDTVICPVCNEPVGNDPHEDCFRQTAEGQEDTGPAPVMPCPACGQPMTPDHNCSEGE